MKHKLRGETAPLSRGQEGGDSAQEPQSGGQTAFGSVRETQSGVQTASSSARERSNRVQEAQTGRSMVEMLGVLAIIGVLSIGGIAGYTQAMSYYKANEIMDTASKLCILAQTYSRQRDTCEPFTLSELDITGPIGCATNIETIWRSSAPEDCAVRITGCQDETAVINFLNTLREPLLSDSAKVNQHEDGLTFCLSGQHNDTLTCTYRFCSSKTSLD